MLWPTTMRCPWCDADDDRVVDSRSADGGSAIRRRRECLTCGRRYTSFERVEDVGLVVVKRDGSKDPFDRAKLESGILKAIKNRPVSPEQVEQVQEMIMSDAQGGVSKKTSSPSYLSIAPCNSS